jgi:hypothetical protein
MPTVLSADLSLTLNAFTAILIHATLQTRHVLCNLFMAIHCQISHYTECLLNHYKHHQWQGGYLKSWLIHINNKYKVS